MTEAEFETLVARLEREARNDPDRYRKRVLLLAFSGYAYITAILLLSLAMLVVSIVAVTEATLLAIKFVTDRNLLSAISNIAKQLRAAYNGPVKGCIDLRLLHIGCG
jgi:hypothetical protein